MRVALLRTAVALVVLTGLGGSSNMRDTLGPFAESARLDERTTAAGRIVRVPRWLDMAPGKLERALLEVDAAIGTYGRVWGEPVEPRAIEIYPFGFQAFPVGDGLAAGYTTRDKVVIIAWFRDPPHLAALSHELGHVARPGWSHERMQRSDKMTDAEEAAKQSQRDVQ